MSYADYEMKVCELEEELRVLNVYNSELRESNQYLRGMMKGHQETSRGLTIKLARAEAYNESLRNLCIDFLDHYDNRKITNGFHDLLAVKVRNKLKG